MSELKRYDVYVDELDESEAGGNVCLWADAEALERENKLLRREIEILRTYGNKDCTAMADAAIAAQRSKP